MESEERNWVHYETSDGRTVERNWANVISGDIPWDEITDEELSKGRLHAGDGSWRWNKDAKLPRKWVPELTRRLKERYDDKLREQLLQFQQVYTDIALGDPTVTGATAADRLRAAAYAQERLIGKVPDKVEVVAEVKKWEGLVEGVLVDVSEDDTSG